MLLVHKLFEIHVFCPVFNTSEACPEKFPRISQEFRISRGSDFKM